MPCSPFLHIAGLNMLTFFGVSYQYVGVRVAHNFLSKTDSSVQRLCLPYNKSQESILFFFATVSNSLKSLLQALFVF